MGVTRYESSLWERDAPGSRREGHCFAENNCTEEQGDQTFSPGKFWGARANRTKGFNAEVTPTGSLRGSPTGSGQAGQAPSKECMEKKNHRNSFLQDGAGFGDVGVEGFDDAGALLLDDAALEKSEALDGFVLREMDGETPDLGVD